MKKQFKTKLRLNSQTIRDLRLHNLEDLRGGYVTAVCPPTGNPRDLACADTNGCRNCG